MQLPPDAADEIRRKGEPLRCPFCLAQGQVNQSLTMFDSGTDGTLIGAILACDHGHQYLYALASGNGRVYPGALEVDYAGVSAEVA